MFKEFKNLKYIIFLVPVVTVLPEAFKDVTSLKLAAFIEGVYHFDKSCFAGAGTGQDSSAIMICAYPSN